MKTKYSNKSLHIVSLSIAVIILLAFFIPSCAPETKNRYKIGVVVTILPQAEFVENVGGDKVTVSVMVPPGGSPHTYEPTPSQMVNLSKAKMYLKVGSGVEFELAWMDKIIALNKQMHVVDCAQGIKLAEMIGEDDDHENKDKHSEKDRNYISLDTHIWMSPLNAKLMINNICDGLSQVDQANKIYYENNRDEYIKKLTAIDQKIRGGLSGVKTRKFMVFHPSFGYFARDYDLVMVPIEREGKEPTAESIAYLIKQAKENNIRVIFASPQYNPESAKVIARSINGTVVFIDPLSKDYIKNLSIITEELIKTMK